MTLPLYAQIALAILWLQVIIEIYAALCLSPESKTGIAIWATIRVVPLVLVTMGVV